MSKQSESSATSDVWVPGAFIELSKDLKKRLSLRSAKKFGMKDGGVGHPSSDATEWSDYEKGIRDDIVLQTQNLTGIFKSGYNECVDLLRRKEIQNLAEGLGREGKSEKEVRSVHRNLVLKTEEHISRAKDPIARASRAHVAADTDLKLFRAGNSLDREASYPDNFMVPVALIVLALAAESILNGALFKDVADGLIGGFLLAFLFSFINVILGFCCGIFGWRLLSHTSPVAKSIGATITTITMTVGGYWNLFIAHFRELVAGVNSETVFDQIVNVAFKVFGKPFDLGSIEAYGLLIFGIIIFYFVAFEGYARITDRYWDYAPHKKREEAASEELSDEKQHLRDEISDTCLFNKNGFLKKIDDDRIKDFSSQKSVDTLVSFSADLSKSINNVNALGNQVLGEYRGYNSRVRPDNRPTHFSENLSVSLIENELRNNGTLSAGQTLDQLLDTQKPDEMAKNIGVSRRKNEKILETLASEISAVQTSVLEELDGQKGGESDGYFAEWYDAAAAEEVDNRIKQSSS